MKSAHHLTLVGLIKLYGFKKVLLTMAEHAQECSEMFDHDKDAWIKIEQQLRQCAVDTEKTFINENVSGS